MITHAEIFSTLTVQVFGFFYNNYFYEFANVYILFVLIKFYQNKIYLAIKIF